MFKMKKVIFLFNFLLVSCFFYKSTNATAPYMLNISTSDIDVSLLQKLQNESEKLGKCDFFRRCKGSFVLKPVRTICLLLKIFVAGCVFKSTSFEKEFFFTGLKQRLLQKEDRKVFRALVDEPEDLTKLKTLYYFCLKNSKYERYLVHLESFFKQREARMLVKNEASKKD